MKMNSQIEVLGNAITQYAKANARSCFREPAGKLRHPFIVPGSCYSNELWDWDSWLTDIALHEIEPGSQIEPYEKGCVLNFLEHTDEEGHMPIFITPHNTALTELGGCEKNIHKPCLAQHALYIAEQTGDAEWLREQYGKIEAYLGWYDRFCFHESGLYVWLDDFAIGVDNDPCTFYRPPKSSGSILLNSLMYMELLATARLGLMLGLQEKNTLYMQKAEKLLQAIQLHCWDERDGFFYSVDTNLLPIEKGKNLHAGCPRHWNTLIQRIEVWACFMPMWASIATAEQAERMVKEHYAGGMAAGQSTAAAICASGLALLKIKCMCGTVHFLLSRPALFLCSIPLRKEACSIGHYTNYTNAHRKRKDHCAMPVRPHRLWYESGKDKRW